jgi:hypothetical protein
MPMKNRVFLFYPMQLLFPAICSAHHGKDFLLTASSSTPHSGQWFGLLAPSFTRTATALIRESGLLHGFASHWNGGLHAKIDHASDLTHLREATLAAPLGAGYPIGSVGEMAL